MLAQKNKGGRPHGSKNKAGAAARAFIEKNSDKVLKKVLQLALDGDITACKMLLDRVTPALKELPRDDDGNIMPLILNVDHTGIKEQASTEVRPTEPLKIAGASGK